MGDGVLLEGPGSEVRFSLKAVGAWGSECSTPSPSSPFRALRELARSNGPRRACFRVGRWSTSRRHRHRWYGTIRSPVPSPPPPLWTVQPQSRDPGLGDPGRWSLTVALTGFPAYTWMSSGTADGALARPRVCGHGVLIASSTHIISNKQ